MAYPTEEYALYQACMRYYEQLRVLAEDNGSDDIVSLEAAAHAAMQAGERFDFFSAALAGVRGQVGALLDDSTLHEIVLRWFAEEGLNVDAFEMSIDEVIDVISEDFIANSRGVAARVYSLGTISASGTGDGDLERITDDPQGDQLNNIGAGSYTALCIADRNTEGGQIHGETFRVTASPKGDSVEQLFALPEPVELVASSFLNGGLVNGNLDDVSGEDADPTALTGWDQTGVTMGSATHEIDRNNAMLLALDSDDNPGALKVKTTTSHTFAQPFSRSGLQFDPNLPYLFAAHVNPAAGSAAGDVTLGLGAKSKTTAVGALGAGWHRINHATNPEDAYYKNWGGTTDANSRVYITINLSSGTLLIANAGVYQYQYINGAWYLLFAAATPFQAGVRADGSGKRFTWTDSITTEQVYQHFLHRHFGRALPWEAVPTLTI